MYEPFIKFDVNIKEPKNASPNLSRSAKILEWTDLSKVVHC